MHCHFDRREKFTSSPHSTVLQTWQIDNYFPHVVRDDRHSFCWTRCPNILLSNSIITAAVWGQPSNTSQEKLAWFINHRRRYKQSRCFVIPTDGRNLMITAFTQKTLFYESDPFFPTFRGTMTGLGTLKIFHYSCSILRHFCRFGHYVRILAHFVRSICQTLPQDISQCIFLFLT